MSIVGMVHEVGAEQMKAGSLRHTFDLEDDVRYSAEVRDFEGEPVLAVWSRRHDGSAPEGLSEVIRCRTHDGRLASMSDYFFCPEVVAEIAAAWGVPTSCTDIGTADRGRDCAPMTVITVQLSRRLSDNSVSIHV